MKNDICNLYVYRNGKAVVRKTAAPAAAIHVAKGPRDVLKGCLVSGCRLGYDGSYLVNGIPEAQSESKAYDALTLFTVRVKNKLAGRPFFEKFDKENLKLAINYFKKVQA